MRVIVYIVSFLSIASIVVCDTSSEHVSHALYFVVFSFISFFYQIAVYEEEISTLAKSDPNVMDATVTVLNQQLISSRTNTHV